jgi:hypothetical protein
LLARAKEAGFEVFVTADKNLSYQQSLESAGMGVVVLSRNEWEWIEAGIPAIARAVDHVGPGSMTFVELRKL